MRVLIPSPLLSYTGSREVSASGGSLLELVADLDRQYPGIRFRVVDERGLIRAHMRFFVNGEQALTLQQALQPDDEVQLVQALSGG